MTTIDRPHASSPLPQGTSVPPSQAANLADVGVRLRAPMLVEISGLHFGETPRSSGEDVTHTALLMECEASALPPILVHRSTMQIVDGVHRVRAAQAKGETLIEAILLDGPPESAFVAAVAVNLGHGLPLSIADRRRAAARIVQSHPHWSDRSIARLVGLSTKTIRSIRDSHLIPSLDSRTGRDGRVRPINSTAGRRAAAEYLAAHPQSSLRTVAKHAGISPNTVRDVRNRMTRGEDPVGCTTRATSARVQTTASGAPQKAPAAAKVDEDSNTAVRPLVASLSRDPAIRMTESGRELLRWLNLHMVEDVDVTALLAAIPDHRQSQLAEIATRCAANWSNIAKKISPQASARKYR
jgi:ParB-like chromosome segregation protein Spo0J